MNAGKLRHRIELQSFTTVNDSYGQGTKTWTTYTVNGTVYAQIVPLQGRELLQAQQISAKVNHRIRIRYHSAVENEHRILFGVRIFEINAIVNFEERNIYHDLYCTEIVS